MRRTLYFAGAIILLFTACSKKNDTKPQANTVTINGTNYSTVVIGNQTWTSVNYNGPGGVNYNDGSNNSVYGKLYTIDEAKAIALPAGWRLPTENDFNNFMPLIGATQLNGYWYVGDSADVLKLMSKTGWTSTNGTNDIGFNAVPAGLYNQVSSDNQQFNGEGTTALFLTSTLIYQNTTEYATFIIRPVTGGAGFTDLVLLPTDRGSVRFVKDN